MERKILGKRVSRVKPLGQSKVQTLRDYYDSRNKILIQRDLGGLGDILMHRMMFEDFRAIHPDFKIVFACPKAYHEAVQDHPFIDELLDSETVDPYDYAISFNTSSACGRYENKLAPLSGLHRSDIWSRHCGVHLKSHDMHIRLTDEEKAEGKLLLSTLTAGSGLPTVAFCPISAMLMKDLNLNQIGGVLDGLRRRGFAPFGLHKMPILHFRDLKFPMLYGLTIRKWMAVLDAADYVISVDTAAFHCAGGLGKPMVGVFSFADGKVYGRYYKNWELVQRHRDNGDWDCGPCYNWSFCPKCTTVPKPCITEITSEEILSAFERLLEKNPAA